MRPLPVLLVFLVLVCSGCMSQGDPGEKFRELSSRADNSTYKVKYNFSRPGTSLVRSGISEPVFYSLNGSTAFKTSVQFMGGSSAINIYNYSQNRSITCTESNSSMNCKISGSTASLYTDSGHYAEKIDKKGVKLAYLGEKTYANRKCSMFGMGIPADEFRTSSTLESGANVKICLDKEKGYVSYISLNLTNPVQSRGKKIKTLFTLKALNYSGEVKEVDVAPDRGLAVDLNCDPLAVDVASVGYSGNFTMSVNGENSTETIDMGERKRFGLEGRSVNGTDSLELFYGNYSSVYSCK